MSNSDTEKDKRAFAAIDGLDSAKRIELLTIIDKFRLWGINEDISLPQLVVVGDQSSGKSSTLEGLTGLAFPVAGDLCTRFATQIVLRRAVKDEASVNVSIIPGPQASGDEEVKKKLQGFRKSMKECDFGPDEFAEILEKAAKLMGLPSSTDYDADKISKRFSDDILKIEISGPGHQHISVVDVPGLFHNPTKHQTEEDKIIIHNLIEEYVKDSRTIIIPVMDARNNFAMQEVFNLAREADPDGIRTVGVITKCDAVLEGDEETVMKIARNTEHQLRHGWFLVKNRSTKEIDSGVSIEGRHINETHFFNNKGPWNTLPKEHVGISALGKFLGNLLYDHIRTEFPKLVNEIKSKINDAVEKREKLGAPRETVSDQRQFLVRTVTQYQSIVAGSLSGNYELDFDAQSPLKLRMRLANLNDEFATNIRLHGHRWTFQTISGENDPQFSSPNSNDDEDKVAEVAENYLIAEDDSDDSDDYDDDIEDIYTWIKRAYKESRGSELPGTVNPIVVQRLFYQQTQNWEGLANEHLETVKGYIQDFIQSLIGRIYIDRNVRAQILQRFETAFIETVGEAQADLKRILHDERGGILQTVNHYFADNLAAARRDRVVQSLKAAGFVEGNLQYNQRFDFGKILGHVHLSNEDQAANDIHDILKAYYKVAMKRFVDNIVLQVVERHFLGPDGPIRFFTSEYIGSLSDDELKCIAAEDYATSASRTELNGKIERLQKAANEAKEFLSDARFR